MQSNLSGGRHHVSHARETLENTVMVAIPGIRECGHSSWVGGSVPELREGIRIENGDARSAIRCAAQPTLLCSQGAIRRLTRSGAV